MWIVEDILEADYGCEERMPGEPLTVLVILRSDDGRVSRFEVAESWLEFQGIDVGDEWPEAIDDDSVSLAANKQQDFMNLYYDALEEYEE